MESQLASNPAPASCFTAEQKEYLKGFFEGLSQRGLVPFAGHTPSGQITNDPASGSPNMAAEELYFNTPVSDLCREERWKYEENPLDIWDKLLAHANENRAPAQDDLFRFKFHGLFYVAPAQDSFMLRLRIPGAILSCAPDARAGRNGEPSRRRARRSYHPQQSSDPRVPRQRHCPCAQRVQALGMTSRGSGADNIRNITASPITGIDPGGAI